MDSPDKNIQIPSLFKPCFENVPGMDNLKKAVVNIYNVRQIAQKRAGFGIEAEQKSYKNNLLIVGPNGSGKTTAAWIVGQCYYKLGISADREPISTDYQTLLSTSAEETAENVKKLLGAASGRVILIENVEEFDDNMAYSPGFEMIDQIVDGYHRSNGAITIIATGDDAGVQELLKKKRNFAQLFDFPLIGIGEYTGEELTQLAGNIAKGMGYTLEPGCEKVLLDEYRYKQGRPDFNYLNLFREMIVEASMNAAARVAQNSHPDESDMALIKAEDFRSADTAQIEADPTEELLGQLDELIGLEGVKESVRLMVSEIKSGTLNKKDGILLAFIGEPGTGKRTVAALTGKIFLSLGIVSEWRLSECGRSDLHIPGADSMVILSGSAKEVEEFLLHNPEMRSLLSGSFTFENYSLEELYRIFIKFIEDSGMYLHPDAESAARNLIATRSSMDGFGNAGGIEKLFIEIVRNHQKRIASLSEEYISANVIKMITGEDLSAGSYTGHKKESIQDWYDELESMTGLASVKEQIKQMASGVRVNQVRKERGLQIQSTSSMHLVFKGNVGTGKKTVAGIIGHIFKDLGVLSNGKVVECIGSDLVGEYRAHTPRVLKAKIQEARGGILYIEEPDSICQSPFDSYGMDAVRELIRAMDNYREDFMVIVSGNADQVKKFMDINQGLRSRFGREFIFDDFSKDELIEIFNHMLASRALTLEDGEEMQKLVEGMLMYCSGMKNFGNARGIRNLIDKLTQIQEYRIAGILEIDDCLSDDALQEIVEDDINTLLEEI